MISTPSPWTGRTLVLTGILLSAFNLRTAVTSLTPLLDTLADTFGFGATMIGVFGMVPTAAFALFGVLTPRITRRIGLENTALLSMLLAAAGLLGRGFSADTWQLLASSAVALAGMGIGNVVLPPLVKRYFPLRIGTVSTAYITMLQMGTMLPALVAVPLAQVAGWQVALGAWSLLAVVAAFGWVAVLIQQHRRGSVVAALHDQSVLRHDEALELTPTEPLQHLIVWRSPLAWGMVFMFGMTSLITYSMFTWLPVLMVDAGANQAFGGLMVAVFSSCSLLSALCVPFAAVRMRNPYPLVVLCVVAYAIAFPGLVLAPMSMPLLWVILLGIGPATFPLALTMINLRTRTHTGATALSGFAQGIGYTLSCVGPVLFGVLHDVSQGWGLPFAFLSVCVVLMAIGGWQVCKPLMLEDDVRVVGG
ncbi:2-nitroimidazole transporter [Halioglobus japonicus]|nr:2-nitroimidazole transporter [Halioglobus japonicus]